jgi:peptidoglycan/xylan/chitin deacetylase (PgdA/CDA1 family)
MKSSQQKRIAKSYWRFTKVCQKFNFIFQKKLKPQLSKIKFSLNLNPSIEKSNENFHRYIPEPYKAVCLISADFELAWAFRFSKKRVQNQDYPLQKANNSRKNVPKLIKLFEQYEIPITWATVGHLFLEKCAEANCVKHPEIIRLPKFKNKYWNHSTGDWFTDDPCTDFKKDPAWYCPDLIKSILASRVRHEIGCHTFSHIDCRDEVCSDEVFLSEINECKRLAKKIGIEMKSFVHPGHQIGNLSNLSNEGFNSYRTDNTILGYPKLHDNGLWEFKNTAILDWRDGWNTEYHIKRYKTIIDRAINNRKVCVFYFHPSMTKKFIGKVFPEILKYLKENDKEIINMTHNNYVDWLNERNN